MELWTCLLHELGLTKSMGLRVRVLLFQTHARKPDGSNIKPINRPTGTRSDPGPCLNEAKIHQISDFGYALPSHVPSSLISIFTTFLSVLNFYPPAGMTRDEHGGARTEPLERALSRWLSVVSSGVFLFQKSSCLIMKASPCMFSTPSIYKRMGLWMRQINSYLIKFI